MTSDIGLCVTLMWVWHWPPGHLVAEARFYPLCQQSILFFNISPLQHPPPPCVLHLAGRKPLTFSFFFLGLTRGSWWQQSDAARWGQIHWLEELINVVWEVGDWRGRWLVRGERQRVRRCMGDASEVRTGSQRESEAWPFWTCGDMLRLLLLWQKVNQL